MKNRNIKKCKQLEMGLSCNKKLMGVEKAVKIINDNPWGLSIKVGKHEIYFPMSKVKPNIDIMGDDLLVIYSEEIAVTTIDYKDVKRVESGLIILK